VTVAELRCHPVTAPLHTPFVTALRRVSAVESLLVELVDSDGRSGWGEAPQVWEVTGESVVGARACVEGPLRAVVVGREPEDLTSVCRQLAGAVAGNLSAKCAVDVALHDLAARRRGVPLVTLLGGTARRVPTDVTVPAGAADAMAAAAKARAAEGFQVLKVKLGADPAGDVDRVRAVRDACGPDARIRVDANQGWTPRVAVTVINALAGADLGVDLVEQPVAARDLDGLAWVHDRSALPILADEAVFSVRDLLEVIRRGAADLVNIKLAKCGGLATARTLLELAGEYGIGTLVGSMLETPVGVGAAASLAAAHGPTAGSDLDAAWWLRRSPVTGGMTYDGACVVLPDAPGSGVSGLAAVASR
jgi:L-Ala-D/L-Glu epimerase / N-acetyl-D-glutamate racemase